MVVRLKQIKYEVIFEALERQIECGDQCLVKELSDFILLAVVDGLGHGEEAAFAAKTAIRVLDEHINESIETLFHLCDQALIKTRGVAMTVVKVDVRKKLTYMGVGNVMGVCWKLDENSRFITQSIFPETGIVGTRLPSTMKAKEIAMASGDLLILATDGLKAGFENETPTFEEPENIAKKIFKTHRNKKDDGLVLVAQLL